VVKKRKPLNFYESSKKALYCAFFCVFNLILTAPALADTKSFKCGSNRVDETVIVKYVHDGDTLHLADKRKVRLIGIDTPELARKEKPADAFAHEAKDALKKLIASAQNKIGLVYGIEKKDRYGRVLAHLFLPDGTNIQAELISMGYAIAYTVPPNNQYADCYIS